MREIEKQQRTREGGERREGEERIFYPLYCHYLCHYLVTSPFFSQKKDMIMMLWLPSFANLAIRLKTTYIFA
jgi:hypothetical protein